MNVQPINYNIKFIRRKPLTSTTIEKSRSTVFKGLFDSTTPDLSQKFQYGLEALDEQSVFVVTSNEASSNMMLEIHADKIDIPVMKKYTLFIKKGDLKNMDELDSNFAIYKKGNKYYILSLAEHPLRKLLVDMPKEHYNKDNIVPSGNVRELNNGSIIHTGEMVWASSGEKEKFVFNTPKIFNPRNAEKYLNIKNIDNLQDFNKRTITALNTDYNAEKEIKGITFEDIGGLNDAIETLRKYVVRPINYPQVYQNIRLNKGILLYGAPRCGKTMLGKALANEVNAKYREYNANEFKSSTVGASESNIRQVFKQAVADAPSITFIDEFDSIAKPRDGSSNARFDDPMVNQFLGCMSDLEKCAVPAFIIAATNMKKLIDPALLASGRFGLHIEVPMPDLTGLKQIFNIHARKQHIMNDVSVNELAQTMLENKFNGSDVAEMITDAFFNVLERLGLNKKMDNKTFTFSDLEKIALTRNDFIKAIQRITKQKI